MLNETLNCVSTCAGNANVYNHAKVHHWNSDDKGKNDISVKNKQVIKKMYKLISYANELFFCIKEFFPTSQWFLS